MFDSKAILFYTEKELCLKKEVNEVQKYIQSMRNNKHFHDCMLLAMFLPILLISFNNLYLNIISVVLLVGILSILNLEETLIASVFLFFFEKVTIIPFLGGSINRIVIGIGILRILYTYFKKKPKINKYYLWMFIFFTIYMIYGVFFSREYLMENTMLYLNIIFFILYGNYLASYKKEDKKEIINSILKAIVLGTIFSIIYGLITQNFMLEKRAGFSHYRFNGTSDPNFLAYYINLALVIQLFNDKKIFVNKILNILVYIILIVGLVLTKSITGIAFNIITILILLIVNNRKKIKKYITSHKRKVAILIASCILVIGVGGYFVVKYNLNQYHYNEENVMVGNNRIADILISIKNGDINRLTSQKTNDWSLYINQFCKDNIIIKLFGRGIQPVYLYSPYFKTLAASHSTYLDLLFCYGIIGMVAILVFIFNKIRKDLYLYMATNNKCINYLRIVLLIYGIQLGIYTNRIFLQFFLL